MRGLLFAGIFVASIMFAAGCGGGKGGTASEQAKEEPKPSGPKPPPEVTLAEGGVPEIDRAAGDTKKAVVLVEFWSMASEPSPNLMLAASGRGGGDGESQATVKKDKVAWHGVRKAEFMAWKYEGYFLRVIMVNVDGAAKKDEVFKFLKERDAKHLTNILWTGDQAAAAEKYGFTGKAPHQVVFGRNGKRVWATGEPLTTTFDDVIFHQLDK
jgi:hypothetical protein